jgi:hypothetical protein
MRLVHFSAPPAQPADEFLPAAADRERGRAREIIHNRARRPIIGNKPASLDSLFASTKANRLNAGPMSPAPLCVLTPSPRLFDSGWLSKVLITEEFDFKMLWRHGSGGLAPPAFAHAQTDRASRFDKAGETLDLAYATQDFPR